MTINDFKNQSEFYHFGLLPRVCIHTPQPDNYSHMYKARELCECGSNEWFDGKMALAEYDGVPIMFKDVHRCKNCNEVRMADHIGNEE